MESDNALMCAGRTLPWLQDTAGAAVWQAWAAHKDDVFILDRENRVLEVVPLAEPNSLADSSRFGALKRKLLAATTR